MVAFFLFAFSALFLFLARNDNARALAESGNDAFVPVLGLNTPIPDLLFTDQAGVQVGLRSLALSATPHRALVLSFIYTRCPDRRECPLVSATFAKMQQLIQQSRLPIHLVEITLDPVHDTSAVMARYGRLFDADRGTWSLLTASQATIDLAARRFGVFVERAPSGIPETHSEAAYIIGPDASLIDKIDGTNWTAEQVVAGAQAAVGQSGGIWPRFTLALTRGVSMLCGGNVPSGTTLATALGVFAAAVIAFGYAAVRIYRAVIS
jgi:cytochrome oxidase Cu insertion factor (SCO1/SenC/PrrC family)